MIASLLLLFVELDSAVATVERIPASPKASALLLSGFYPEVLLKGNDLSYDAGKLGVASRPTNASGDGPNSYLHEFAPSYGLRQDAKGNLETGPCSADIASDHTRMQKQRIDIMLLNAHEYKIDAFCLNILSFHFPPTCHLFRKRCRH